MQRLELARSVAITLGPQARRRRPKAAILIAATMVALSPAGWAISSGRHQTPASVHPPVLSERTPTDTIPWWNR